MKPIFKIILAFTVFAILYSCNRNPLKVNISGITDEVEIIRYEKELVSFGNNPTFENILSIRERYPEFTDLFSAQIIRIGFFDEEEVVEGVHAFLTDTMIQSVYRLVSEKFADFSPVQKRLTDAFKHYRYYFPGKPLPTIYTCISGFNESAFVAEGLIGISLDKYLGAETAYYPMLGFPRYKQRKMIPEMIPADALYVWAMGEFEIGSKATTLLDHIVHEGKLLYFLEAMMPEAPDTLITGFTAKQTEWCKKNEPQIWTYLIEHELLYSTKKMDIVRYINDGPHTNGFPLESPARTGAWLGRQIIRKYLKRNPDVTLERLMENKNYQEILSASGYLP